MIDDEIAGRVALVTAAAGQGVGSAVADRLAAAGAVVVVTDVHEQRTAAVAEQIAARHPETTVVGIPMDAGDRQAIDAALERVEAELGPVRILVNNAAVNILGGIFDFDPADWDRVIAVNLTGAWYLARRTMPAMRDAGGGVVLNISSFSADIGGEGMETPYAVSKGGMNTLTRALAHEGGPYDIRCNTVAVGVIPGTWFIDRHPEIIDSVLPRSPLGRLPEVADVAEMVAYLAGRYGRNITGEIVNIAGGAYMRN